MKKGKKILSILLAASVGVTGLIGSSTVYGAQKTETKQKYVVVLDPGHGGNESGAYAVHNCRTVSLWLRFPVCTFLWRS